MLSYSIPLVFSLSNVKTENKTATRKTHTDNEGNKYIWRFNISVYNSTTLITFRSV